MKKIPGDIINTGSLVLLLFFSVVEVELYLMGGVLIDLVGRDVFISLFLGAGISYFLLFFLIRLGQHFPRQTFFEYLPQVWGRPVSYLLYLTFILYWLEWLTKMMWQMADINVTFFLPNTPILIVVSLYILAAVLLARYGLVAITRFFELMLAFFFIPYLIAMIIALTNIRISYFFPLLTHSWWDILKGALLYAGMFQGLEVILFALPFTKKPSQALLPIFTGLTLVHVVVLLQIVATLGNLGAASAQSLVYPSADMLSVLQVPGWPVERFEPLLTMPWFIAVFTSVTLAVYLISRGILKLVPRLNGPLVFWGTGLLSIPLLYLIPNILWSLSLTITFWLITPFFIYLIPLITYGLALFRHKGGSEEL